MKEVIFKTTSQQSVQQQVSAECLASLSMSSLQLSYRPYPRYSRYVS